VVEIENALRNDFDFLDCKLTASERREDMTPLKIALLAEAQSRFVADKVPTLFGAPLADLWTKAAGLFDPDADAILLAQRLAAIAGGEQARRSIDASDLLRSRARASEIPISQAQPLVVELQTRNIAIVASLKHQLRQGLIEFETHERDLLDRGAGVPASLTPIPDALNAFHERLATTIERHLAA
jgi:hypothetical protein